MRCSSARLIELAARATYALPRSRSRDRPRSDQPCLRPTLAGPQERGALVLAALECGAAEIPQAVCPCAKPLLAPVLERRNTREGGMETRQHNSWIRAARGPHASFPASKVDEQHRPARLSTSEKSSHKPLYAFLRTAATNVLVPSSPLGLRPRAADHREVAIRRGRYSLAKRGWTGSDRVLLDARSRIRPCPRMARQAGNAHGSGPPAPPECTAPHTAAHAALE